MDAATCNASPPAWFGYALSTVLILCGFIFSLVAPADAWLGATYTVFTGVLGMLAVWSVSRSVHPLWVLYAGLWLMMAVAMALPDLIPRT